MKDLIKGLVNAIKSFVGAFAIDKLVDDTGKGHMTMTQMEGKQPNEQQQKEISAEAKKLYEQRQ